MGGGKNKTAANQLERNAASRNNIRREGKVVTDASSQLRSQTKPHLRASEGLVQKHGASADSPRANQNHRSQGQGTPPHRRSDGDPRQARRSRRTPPRFRLHAIA